MPPRLATTVGIAVATTVDSIAARKMDSMIPTRTHRFRPSSFMGPPRAWGPSPRPALRLARPSSVAAGATGAAAQRAQVRIGVEARVPVDPGHAQPFVRSLDLFRPHHLGRERLERATPSAHAVAPEPVERIDGPMAVGPVHTERVSADEVHVFRNTRVGLAENLETEAFLHVPPPIAGCFKRIPARR